MPGDIKLNDDLLIKKLELQYEMSELCKKWNRIKNQKLNLKEPLLQAINFEILATEWRELTNIRQSIVSVQQQCNDWIKELRFNFFNVGFF